jgi:hypothetical protein
MLGRLARDLSFYGRVAVFIPLAASIKLPEKVPEIIDRAISGA